MKRFKGYMMIVGAALLWGLSATAAKTLLNQQVDTILLVQSRVTFSAVIMGVVLLLFRPGVLRVAVRDLWRFALLGILGIAGANFTYYYVIRESTVATGIILQYTAPLLVMAYGVLSREEEFAGAKLFAAVLSLGGCFLAVGAYDSSLLRITPLALLSGIGSIFSFAFLTVYTRHLLARYNLWTMTFYALVSATVFWLFVNPPTRIAEHFPPPAIWGALVLLAAASVLIPHSLYFSGLRHVVPSKAIITSTLEPVAAIFSAAVFLGEYLRPLQIGGAVLVLVAISVLQLRPEAGDEEPIAGDSGADNVP